MFKDFTKDFEYLLSMLKQSIPFAFTRFSDGEGFILQNKKLILSPTRFETGEISGAGIYTEEEQKEFDPEKHSAIRTRLIKALSFSHPRYYKGIVTPTDAHVSLEMFDLMKSLCPDHDNLTFSNLLINSNYKRFVEEIIPILCSKEVLYICHKNADLSRLPFIISKDFRIGSNCMIDNLDTVNEVKDYIRNNQIENAVVLCSAASLSNFVIHDCFEENQKNTFLDIGSCLNPLLKLNGWIHTRGYLTHYWLGNHNHYGTQIDKWS